MNDILLFRLGGLGDLLVAFPSIYFVRKKLPGSFLTLVCREEYGTIFKETRVVDAIVSAEDRSLSPLFAGNPPGEHETAQWLSRFSLVLGWTQGRQSLSLADFFFRQENVRTHVFSLPQGYRGQISRFFFNRTSQSLADLGLPGSPFHRCTYLPLEGIRPGSELKSQDEDGKAVAHKKLAVIHPGSGSRNKCWPLANFLNIVKRLESCGVHGTLVTGEAEGEIRNLIKDTELPSGWTWLERPPVLELCSLLRRADVYLGNDSGVTHLAAACGTSVVSLFREEHTFRWRPYGRVRLISSPDVREIDIETVWEALQGLVFSS